MVKKYIINSGCSYGRFAIALQTLLRTNSVDIQDDIELVVLDVHSQSQSPNYIADSIIYTVNYLIENKNVNKDDIFVISEWTELERISFYLPSYIDEIISLDTSHINTINLSFKYSKKNGTHLVNYNEDFDKLDLENFNIKWYKRYAQLPLIEDTLYYTPNHVDYKDYIDTPVYHPFKSNRDVFHKLEYEFLIHNWFDSLLKTQFYLDKMGISYKFLSIYNPFSSLGKTQNNFITDFKEPLVRFNHLGKAIDNSFNFKKYKRNTLDTKNRIDNIFPQIKPKYNLIDFSKWWFYEDDMNHGGIDEFAMTHFKYSGFIKNNFKKNREEPFLNLSLPKYTNHPVEEVYEIILFDILRNTCDFVNTKNDYNSLLNSAIEKYKPFNDVIIQKLHII